MNIWIEYWEKSKEPSKNTHAQIREQAHWVPPDPKTVHKRFCQGREDANKIFALVVAASGAVGAITSIIGGIDPNQLQTMNMIGGLTFIVVTVWVINRGLGLIKKG